MSPRALRPTVLIRADGGHDIGLGHVMRCLSLAAGLKRLGARVVFVTRARERSVLAKIRAADCAIVGVPVGISWNADARRLANLALSMGARAVVTDSYFIDASYLGLVKDGGARLLAINDGPGGRFTADLVLNQNAGARRSRYSGARTRFLLGPRYALLRPSFAHARSLRKRGGTPRVLVMMGGSDSGGLTVRALRSLDALSMPFAFDIVAGAAYAGIDALRLSARKAYHAATVHHDPKNLVALMGRATLAVSAASTTSYELACLGIPAVLLQDLANQRAIIKGLERADCAAGAGAVVPFPDAKLRTVVGRLLDDPKRLARMSRAGRRLVDGAGARRVAGLLIGPSR